MARKPYEIKRIAVRGFKSIGDEQSIEIRPLTLLAGANSSGKSSIMQPLLLLKQTIEHQGDPGALLLDGPNVQFTSTDQLLSKVGNPDDGQAFSVRIETGSAASIESEFRARKGYGFEVARTTYGMGSDVLNLVPNMSPKEINLALPKDIKSENEYLLHILKKSGELRWQVSRDRCFLRVGFGTLEKPTAILSIPDLQFAEILKSIIHLPGLRGNPRRTYPRAAAGPHFPGSFEIYVASIINRWQTEKDDKLNALSQSLADLGLTWKVETKSLDDTQVEIKVGRLTRSRRGGARDLVSIADVGFGVSQSLPVLVALIEAQPGQLVYLEQPEIHLHPKAQRLMARELCKAAKRGVLLVVETHSALLLREVQTLVAKGEMPQEAVCFHWFQRDEQGCTKISSATLDEDGAYGDWPEDFDETELDAEQDYLDAVEMRGLVE